MNPPHPSGRTIALEGIGPVLFVKSRRARSIRITVRASQGVRVVVPIGVSFADAERFAASRSPWIRRTLRRIEHARTRCRDAVLAAECLDSRQARSILATRLAELAEEHGLPYKRLSVRKQRTLWGSASTAGRIQLNAFLAVLPQDLSDYVVLHELVHTRVNGHGRAFWRELERRLDDVPRRRSLLREYSLALF